MNYYKVLGIEENASQDEIRQAYEKQVNTFKKEVKDQKRLKKFLDLFKEAYDELNCEKTIVQDQPEEIFDEEVSELFKNSNIKEKPGNVLVDEKVRKTENPNIENSYESTVLMSREDIVRESLIQCDKPKEGRIIFRSKEDFEDCDGFFEEEEDFEERIIKRIREKSKHKSKNNNNRKKKSSTSKDNVSKNVMDSRVDLNQNNVLNKKILVKKENKPNDNSNLLLIALKIIVLPTIAILSILIFICRIISISSWLVSKVIIIAVIAILAIHGYQIYVEKAIINYNIFIGCGIGFMVSLFLPSIVRIIPNTLYGINNRLKSFVF